MRAKTLMAAMVGAVALLAVGSGASASMSLAASLAELVHEADDVIVATTVAQHSHYDEHGRIVTDVELWVEHSEKGSAQPGDTVVVRRLGGEVDGIGMQVVGEPAFVDGERQLLFARHVAQAGWMRTVAMSQGRMRLSMLGGETWVMPGGEGLAMLARSTDGTLKRASRPGPRPLEELLAEIRELVQQGAR